MLRPFEVGSRTVHGITMFQELIAETCYVGFVAM